MMGKILFYAVYLLAVIFFSSAFFYPKKAIKYFNKIGFRSRYELMGGGMILLFYALIIFRVFGIVDPWYDEILVGGASIALGGFVLKIGSVLNNFIFRTYPSLKKLVEIDFPNLKSEVDEIKDIVNKIAKKKN